MLALPVSAYQVGIVCALPKEMAAVLAVLDEEHEPLETKDPQDNNSYLLGRIWNHNVVVACLPAGVYGTNAAARVAKDMLRTFLNVRIGLMVGIGGGIPNLPTSDIRLGDVVVSQPDKTFGGVVQYDIGKQSHGRDLVRKGYLDKPPGVLLTALSAVQTKARVNGSQIPAHLQQAFEKHTGLKDNGYTFPGVEKDQLHCTHCSESRRWWKRLWLFILWLLAFWRCEVCHGGIVLRKVRNKIDPILHYGTIASGNILVKDSALRDRLGHEFDAKCVEMEAAGLMDDFRCIVIRGICDYADTYKNDEWQEYASLTAATFAKELLSYVVPERIKEEEPLRKIIGVFEKQVSISKDLLEVTKEQNRKFETLHQDQAHRQCHQSFKTTTYAVFKNNVPERIAGTCQWVLQNSMFIRWYKNTQDDLLWISADPGCGKSVLARSMIDIELKNDENCKICYFFFKDNETQNNLVAAINALIHQLFDQEPQLISHAMPAWQSTKNMLNSEVDKLWQIFIEAAKDPRASSIVCVLDALDECRIDDQKKLISWLNDFYQKISGSSSSPESSQKGRLKFLVTSRPYDNIQVGFQLPPHLPSIQLRGEDENEQIHEEINMVIKLRVDEVASRLSLKQHTRDHLEFQLLEMEHRTYLWLYLAIESTYETYRDSLRPDQELLERLPSTIEDAYEKILNRVRKEKQNDVKLIFQIIVGAKRPLTIKEMAIALGIATNPQAASLQEACLDETHLRNQVRQLCGLFCFISDSRIHLIHQTAKEFLIRFQEFTSTQVGWKYCLIPAEVEHVMARVCVDFMSFEDIHDTGISLVISLNFNGYDFTDYALDQTNGVECFAGYAAANWANHIRGLLSSMSESFMVKVLKLYDVTSAPFDWWFPVFWATNEPYSGPPTISALSLAAWNGHKEIVNWCLKENVDDIDRVDGSHKTALMWACEQGHLDLVELLLDKGADVNAHGDEYGTALQTVSARGDLIMIELLLSHGADVNAQCEHDGDTALGAASGHGNLAAVKLLLDGGADVDLQGRDRFTALQTASFRGHLNVVELLLEKGADINAPGRWVGTALQAASLKGELAVVELLLEKGADVNARGGDYGTALQAGSASGELAVIKLLLEKGADINAQGSQFGTALHNASLSRKLAVVELLLEKGADVNARGGDNGTVLQVGISSGELAVVKLLLEKGANVDAQGGFLGTALQIASFKGDLNIVESLIEKGADIHAQGGNVGTALEAASREGHLAVIKLLISHGADAHVMDGRYGTAIEAASANGHRDVVEFLVSKGAIPPEDEGDDDVEEGRDETYDEGYDSEDEW